MIFPTRINGIPCQCEVTVFSAPYEGSASLPPDPGEFEFRILDRQGYRAKWLEVHVNTMVSDRLYREFLDHRHEHHLQAAMDVA